MNLAIGKDFNFYGVVTKTSGGWSEKHFFAATYSMKGDMRSFAITVFFFCIGVGWQIRENKTKEPNQ